MAQKGACGMVAGSVGAFCAAPTDVALVRMQGDSTFPKSQRRNYRSLFNALHRIPREEGFFNLWKGAVPTMGRGASLNFGMFLTYEELKERLSRRMPNNVGLSWFIASVFAGTFSAACSLPFDNAKTKMQKMKPGPDG